MSEYTDLLKDPRWQKKRLEVFERDNWECSRCSFTESQLNVHHIEYIRGKNPWDYDMNKLITLCNECHEDIHKHKETIKSITDFDMIVCLSILAQHMKDKGSFDPSTISMVCDLGEIEIYKLWEKKRFFNAKQD